MSWKVWRWYLIAAVATLLACLLWFVVFAEVRDPLSASRASVIAPYVSSGRLPVVPVLRPAYDEFSACVVGRGCCWLGYRVKPVVGADGVEHLERVQTASGPVAC